MRSFRYWVSIAYIALSIALSGCSHPISHPANPAPDHAARFGVFIGIEDYAHPDITPALGAALDAKSLRDYFVTRCGFSEVALLLNEDGTRVRIKEAFQQLRRLVKKRRVASDEPVTVVVTFAGHGALVRNRNPLQDPEALADSTWSPFDATRTGSNEIRDDDIFRICDELTRRFGATVFVLSDSCNSGSVHRGEYVTPRSWRSPSSPILAGPAGPLMAPLEPGEPWSAERPEGAGLILFAACSDGESAFGSPSGGRFTRAFLDVLRREPGGTYRELHKATGRAMRRRWPLTKQTPIYRGPDQVRFLANDPATAFARLVEGSMVGREATITKGDVDGVTPQTRFVFYASVADALSQRTPVGVGQVTRIDPFTSRVQLPRQSKIDESCCARADRIQLSPLIVRTVAPLPEPVVTALRALDKSGAIRLANDRTDSAITITRTATTPLELGVFASSAERPAADSTQPRPLYSVRHRDSTAAANILAEYLQHAGRTLRLLSLSAHEDRVGVEAIPYRRTASGLERVPRDWKSNAIQLRDGDRFTVKITNRGLAGPVYPHVLYMNDDQECKVLYPKQVDAATDVAVPPGQSVEIGRLGGVDRLFRATLEPDETSMHAALKVIVANVRLDLTALGGLRRGDGATAPADDPLATLIREVLAGTAATRRDGPPPIPPQSWAATELYLEVRR